MQSPDMKDYYNFRSSLYNLYDNDVYYGDLCGSVLHIRDKNRCINSMSTRIQEHQIVVEFDDNTKFEKINKIANDIKEQIGVFITNNADKISDFNPNVSEEKVLHYVKSKSCVYCDAGLCGNILTINL